MTAEAFSADLDWLGQFGNQLNSSTCSLQAALDSLKETGPIRTGHDDLDEACLAFHDRWDDSLGMMNTAVAAMSEKLKVCVQNYRTTESAQTTTYANGVPSTPGTPQATVSADSHITAVLG